MRLSNLDSTLVLSLSAMILTGLLRENGLDAEGVAARGGVTLDDLEDPNLLLTGRQTFEIQRGFAIATADQPHLWVEVANRYNLLSYNPLGFAMVTAPTLEDSINVLRRLVDLHDSAADLRFLEVDEETICAELDHRPLPVEMRDFLRCRDEIMMTNSLHFLATTDTFPLERIESTSRIPAEHGYDYGAPLRFSEDCSRWFWKKAAMRGPTSQSDPQLHKFYLRRAMTMVAAIGGDDPLEARLDLVLDNRAPGDWTLDQTAASLNMSTRSLQRNLARRGKSFRTVVEAARERMSKKLLLSTERPVADIAWELGYADTSSFTRAFHRWTGVSPSAFRWQRAMCGSVRPSCPHRIDRLVR